MSYAGLVSGHRYFRVPKYMALIQCNYTDATGYGLGASVWGSDLTQATRIASQIESGSKSPSLLRHSSTKVMAQMFG
jgi:hypothetical protein